MKNKIIETRVFLSKSETGGRVFGKSMTLLEWCWWLDREARDKATFRHVTLTEDSLSTFLIDNWEVAPRETYDIVRMYFRTQVPEAVWDDLDYEVGRNGLEYTDNYRAFRWRDGFMKQQYKYRERKGCCGSFETSTTYDGDRWIIGCNHGH